MSSPPPPDATDLAAALRACAGGFYPAEAAVELLICHASWLHRKDFRDGYVHVGTSITDSITTGIDWPAAIAALDNGGLPCSGSERRVLRLAASLADGIPVDLRDTLTGMDAASVGRAVQAMLHAARRVSGVDRACPDKGHPRYADADAVMLTMAARDRSHLLAYRHGRWRWG